MFYPVQTLERRGKSVERRAIKTKETWRLWRIQRIAQNGMPDGFQVHTDLMRASRMGTDLEV